MNKIELPTLLFWENGNTFYGSCGRARFYIQPVTHQAAQNSPDDQPPPTLEAELWPGPLTKALSTVLARASFPLSQEGLAQAAAWLEGQAVQLNQG